MALLEAAMCRASSKIIIPYFLRTGCWEIYVVSFFSRAALLPYFVLFCSSLIGENWDLKHELRSNGIIRRDEIGNRKVIGFQFSSDFRSRKMDELISSKFYLHIFFINKDVFNGILKTLRKKLLFLFQKNVLLTHDIMKNCIMQQVCEKVSL